jgi:hypothetical protein
MYCVRFRTLHICTFVAFPSSPLYSVLYLHAIRTESTIDDCQIAALCMWGEAGRALLCGCRGDPDYLQYDVELLY